MVDLNRNPPPDPRLTNRAAVRRGFSLKEARAWIGTRHNLALCQGLFQLGVGSYDLVATLGAGADPRRMAGRSNALSTRRPPCFGSRDRASARPRCLSRHLGASPCSDALRLCRSFGVSEARIWRTEYLQRLGAVEEAAPVRQFTQSPDLRPYLDHSMAQGRRPGFLPPMMRGFKRLSLTLCKA